MGRTQVAGSEASKATVDLGVAREDVEPSEPAEHPAVDIIAAAATSTPAPRTLFVPNSPYLTAGQSVCQAKDAFSLYVTERLLCERGLAQSDDPLYPAL